MRVASIVAKAALAGVLALLSGCSYLYPRVQIDAAPAPLVAPPVPLADVASGSLFQPATFRPLFEDHRARVVGDTLTVTIVEKISASQKSTSSVDKSGSVDAGITAVPGVSANSLLPGRTTFGGSSGSKFAGKGATESSNDFAGTITAVVREVLPNGHLIIAGEKQIGVNNNVDVLRFTGQVDPRAIQPGNSVPSAQIANVRVEHRGRGAQAEAQVMGWLSRVFLSLLPI